MSAEGNCRDFEEEASAGFGVEDVLQTLALVLEEVAEFHVGHDVILEASLGDGFLTPPAVVAEVEGGRLAFAPSAGLANQVVQVLEGGIGLNLEFQHEVLDFG